jgi:hypothetical protein
MRKTSFAGLTALDPAESLFTDGSSFTARNPDITDYFLRLGARLHHHDGAPALADPTAPLSVDLQPYGGALPADTTIMVAYTLLDDRGGETLPSPAAMVTTSAGIATPDEEPLTEVLYDTGNLTIGTYRYVVTLVDGAGGETQPSPVAIVTREPGTLAARIRISGLGDLINDAPGAERYRLYRAKDAGALSLLFEGGNGNDIVVDDGNTPLDCSAHPPDTNTTGQTNEIVVTAPSSAAMGNASAWRLYVSSDGGFASPSQYGPTREVYEAGGIIEITQILVTEGAPPDVSTAVAGAAKINPDTDLLDWHWKRPVATVGDLPLDGDTAEGDMRLALDDGALYSYRAGAWAAFTAPAAHWLPPVADIASLPMVANAEGDVRLALATFTLHAWDGAAWQPVTGTGGGGGGTGGHTIADESTDLPARTRLAFDGDGVTVTDDPGGDRTLVTIPGTQWLTFEGAGVSVDGDVVTIPGGAGHVISDGVLELPAREKLTFSGAAVSDDPGNDQTVVAIPAAPTRTTVHFAKTMALNETAIPNLAAAKSYRLLKLVSTVKARVQLYTTAAARTADAARVSGTPPSGPNHGVIVDVELDAGEPLSFTPAIDGWNDDDPPAAVAYARVTALAAGDVALDLTIVPTEA